jgi:predicted ArsR family transcriptional regulator
MDRDFDADVEGIAALGDSVRRALYRFVVEQVRPTSREQAAVGTGVALHTAKFHLDKLVDEGLLEIEYARPPGRGGPGAGRPAKLYRRSGREFAVSLPERRYELAGRLFAQAVVVAEREGVPVGDALHRVAHDAGRALGVRARQLAGPRPGRSSVEHAITVVLRSCGFEPDADEAGITLSNCPFHALAQDYTALVCGMNLQLIGGVLEGAGLTGLGACLDPAPGRCCVRVTAGS